MIALANEAIEEALADLPLSKSWGVAASAHCWQASEGWLVDINHASPEAWEFRQAVVDRLVKKGVVAEVRMEW